MSDSAEGKGSGVIVLEDLTPEAAGWTYSGLRIVALEPGEAYATDTGDTEMIVVPLHGSASVSTGDGDKADLAGRASVFDGPTDVAYIPINTTLTITGSGKIALASAKATNPKPFRYVPVADVPVELRGAGNCSRQVHNFGVPDVLDADRIIACEVLTPGGNWSSYPPHKHDEERDGESVLEEIYYFEVADGGPGYQRVYGTPERPIDVTTEVRTGEIVLVPHGWHGPSMAAPGYDLYYLNVMAGPGARAWLIRDDPEHAWIRDTWADQEIDPRLPFGKGNAS
ncbi:MULTISPECIES: 5-deoxy-glucuronate isomerase [Catenuloplanes]|uniref:5-deoxy-glucuronate isomerase n=1 Tax=Catenuloplanes niger TaxID=587534 RepID=A0AAE3ZXY0_9ACTN|nr:5-deoxy-glucuronate isomerase [Catenuloplanes niger]MDR7325860.1 5-deoxy-glucuronate isomerase [Catenuloplanes niger]